MRAVIIMFAAAAGLAAFTADAEACSIRGTYCGYPSWAANAFEGRKGFQGNPGILTNQYVGQPPRKVAKSRK